MQNPEEKKSEMATVGDIIKQQFRISGVSDEEYQALINEQKDLPHNSPNEIKRISFKDNFISISSKGTFSESQSDSGFNLISYDADGDDDDDNDEIFSKPVNSAFDINLAEFPIAYLNRGGLPKNANKTEIRYSDFIKGRNGEPIERIWTVQALSVLSGKELDKIEAQKEKKLSLEERQLGFGGPQTLEVIYELFQLWKEQGFDENKIHIGTYYHLLKRLGWDTGKSNYQLLKKTLNCIHGIHFQVDNALYLPPPYDRYETRKFYLFPSLHTYSKEDKEMNPDDYLYLSVDEHFHAAIKAKTTFFIPFDRHYFKTLKPMEQKVALMLAKVFTPYKKNQRFEWKRSIKKLSQQIPIITDEKFQIKRQLKRTCDGLIQKNFPFLSKYSFEGENIIFYNNIQTSLNLISEPQTKTKDPDSIEWLINEQLKICGDKHSVSFYTIVAKYVPIDLIYQCLSEAKQEGKVKRKLYTKLIKEKAREYLEPYVKYSSDEKIEVNEEEAKKISYEILLLKESRSRSQKNQNNKDLVEEPYDDPNQ